MKCGTWVVSGVAGMVLGLLMNLGRQSSMDGNTGAILFCYGLLSLGVGLWNRWYHNDPW